MTRPPLSPLPLPPLQELFPDLVPVARPATDWLDEFDEAPPASDLVLIWRNPDEAGDFLPVIDHPDIDADFSPDLIRLGYQRNRHYNILICRICERCVRAEPEALRTHSSLYHGVRVPDEDLGALDGFGPPDLYWLRNAWGLLVRPVVGVRIEIGYRCDLCGVCYRDRGQFEGHYEMVHPLSNLPDTFIERWVQTLSEVSNNEYFPIKLDMRAYEESRRYPPELVAAPVGDSNHLPEWRPQRTTSPDRAGPTAAQLSAYLFAFPNSDLELAAVTHHFGEDSGRYTPLYYALRTPSERTDTESDHSSMNDRSPDSREERSSGYRGDESLGRDRSADSNETMCTCGSGSCCHVNDDSKSVEIETPNTQISGTNNEGIPMTLTKFAELELSASPTELDVKQQDNDGSISQGASSSSGEAQWRQLPSAEQLERALSQLQSPVVPIPAFGSPPAHCPSNENATNGSMNVAASVGTSAPDEERTMRVAMIDSSNGSLTVEMGTDGTEIQTQRRRSEVRRHEENMGNDGNDTPSKRKRISED